MPKIWTPKKLLKKLQKLGFEIDHITGSHFVLYNPKTNKRTLIAYHGKDIPKGTLGEILKQAGISKEDLEK